ncbi:hypothetical protein FB45DRAFT_781836 [Roridomyces roridus]|uniref:DUF1746 domain-containing protein n=1 Tax=Roridomyces roridus TaxID=1738132 RepID=A0AAD7CHC0_9AGAR|nr:hypothetical protein FB45DRAFT_781836 [Roridomyces roridus]
MNRRRHAQRKHIIQSFDALLYQLHVLAFFRSPAIVTLLFRLVTQSQCSRQAREPDAAWSLRAFFAFLLIPNAVILWSHALGPSDGKAVVLDFIGMAPAPSKAQVLSLDVLIVFLQMVLAAIAHETSLAKDDSDSISPASLSPSDLPNRAKSPYVIDLKLGDLVARMRNPVPVATRSSSDGLPMPNTTPWPPGMSLRLLLGGLAGTRRESNENGAANERPRNIPGALYNQ